MIAEIIDIIKNITQIAFWLIAGTIAVLTYWQARKTILQPLHTEIFKSQLQKLSEILSLFLGKHELELRNQFGFEELMHANIIRLCDVYAEIFFDINFDPDSRPYSSQYCPQRNVKMGASPSVSTAHIEVENNDESIQKIDPRVRAAMWGRYQREFLAIPKDSVESNSVLTRYIEDPLIPDSIVELLSLYRSTIEKNQSIFGNILDRVAPEMPEKYQSLDDLEKFQPDWIRKIYMKEFIHLKPLADEIISYTKNYLKSNMLTHT